MIKIFYGENRLEIEKNVKEILGPEYEVIEGESLTADGLADVFWGTTLLTTGPRKILLKNLTDNPAAWAKLPNFLTTEAQVVIWELKIDRRSAEVKALEAAGAEMREFRLVASPPRGVFGILETAYTDGPKAVRQLEEIKLQEDPYMFVGLLAKQALDRYRQTNGRGKERRVLKALARVDLQMKTATIDPWLLIESFLLEVATLN